MDELRPGLSATAKITTAHKPSALTIPIQALVQRDPAAEQVLAANNGKPPANASTGESNGRKPQMVQGVYILHTEKGKLRVVFVPVSTGVTGTTDIEVLGGLKAGEEIVTGRYKILRFLKSGTVVKRDNTPESATDADKT